MKRITIHETVIEEGGSLTLSNDSKVIQIERFSRRTPEDAVIWLWRVIFITETKT